MIKLKNLSVLYRNILTYSALILLCCIVIGMFAVGSGMVQLRKQYQEYRTNILDILIFDLDKQYDLMNDYALKIATDYSCNPSRTANTPIFEIELIDSLEKYSNVSPIAERMFLMYEGNSSVFTGGAKNRLSSFVQKYMDISDSEELYGQIVSCVKFSILSPENDSGYMLWVFPIYFQNYTVRRNAYVCYVTSSSMLYDRIASVTASQDGYWELRYAGHLFTVCGTESNRGEAFSAASTNGFSVRMQCSEGNGGLRYFINLNTIMLLILSVVFLLLSVMFSYKSYKPVRELIRKLEGNRKSHNENEFLKISSHIDELQLQRDNIVRKLDEQQKLLIHQRLLLIIRDSDSRKAVTGWDPSSLGGRYHLICALRIPSDPDGEGADSLCLLVEELSDELYTFFAVYVPHHKCIVVLISACEPGELGDAPDLLMELLDASDIKFRLGTSSVFEDLNDFSRSFYQSLSAQDHSGRELVEHEPHWNDEAALKLLTTAVQKGDRKEAENHLDIFIKQTEELVSEPSVLQLVYTALFFSLIRLYSGMHLPVDTSHLAILLGITNPVVLREDAVYHIQSLCRNQESHGILPEILKYIDRHFAEYDFDQNTIAKHFGISVSQLYRLIKEGTGNNFSYYFTNIRIRHAKEMLENGASVSDTSSQIGYSSVSFFIRTFKRITGYTPANYRMLKNAPVKSIILP